MRIEWEKIEFKEEEFLKALKEKSFDSEDDIPSTLFQGPFQVESLLDPMSFSKRHNPIIGHCDFNISERRASRIMMTEGVDFLRVITRYSFIFSPGKAFDEEEVKDRIKEVLGVYSLEESDNLEELKKELVDKGKYCIYVRNGEIHTVTEEDVNFESMVAVYKESHKKFGGEIHEGE
jgi:hypothetical protein